MGAGSCYGRRRRHRERLLLDSRDDGDHTTRGTCTLPGRRGKNGWRVFRRADASRIGPRGGEQRHTRAVRSDKGRRLRGRAGTGMRVIVGFFGPCAPDVLTAHVAIFSHAFKRFDRFIQLATSSMFTGSLNRRGYTTWGRLVRRQG